MRIRQKCIKGNIEKSFPHPSAWPCAGLCCLQCNNVFLKEVFKLLFGEHGIDDLKNNGSAFFVKLVDHIDPPTGRSLAKA